MMNDSICVVAELVAIDDVKQGGLRDDPRFQLMTIDYRHKRQIAVRLRGIIYVCVAHYIIRS